MPRSRFSAPSAALAALAVAAALASPAMARSSFSGKLCNLFPPSSLSGADLDAPCVQLPTKHTPLYVAVTTANWGKAKVGGGDYHFLGFQVIKPTAAYLALEKKQLPRIARQEGMTKINNGYESIEPTNIGDARGFATMATRLVNGYICNVTFVDRSTTDPPTKTEAYGTAFLIAQFCDKVK